MKPSDLFFVPSEILVLILQFSQVVQDFYGHLARILCRGLLWSLNREIGNVQGVEVGSCCLLLLLLSSVGLGRRGGLGDVLRDFGFCGAGGGFLCGGHDLCVLCVMTSYLGVVLAQIRRILFRMFALT